MPNFDEWFKRATGHKPYPFQVCFASEPGLLSNPSPSGRGKGEGLLVDVPTGLGKTAMALDVSLLCCGRHSMNLKLTPGTFQA